MNTNSYYFFLKHLIFVLLGLFLIIISSIIDKERIINFSLVLFVITFISLLLVPLIGVEVKGSKRWLDIGFLPRFQPIELLKPFVIVFLGVLLSSNYINNKYFRYLFSFILILPIIILLALQPDMRPNNFNSIGLDISIFISGISLLILFSSFAVLVLLLAT